MDFMRQSWTQIRAYLEGLSRAEAMFIVSLMVIGVLLVGIVVYMAGTPDRVPLSGFAAGRSAEVMQRLKGAGLEAEMDGPQLVIAAADYNRALMLMAQMDLLGEDASAAFDEAIASQSPWLSDKQDSRNFLLAKQEYLARIISEMPSIATADVVLAVPEQQGFGKTHKESTASVMVQMAGGRKVSGDIVESIAGLVSYGVEGMPPQNVAVIAGGRQYTVKDEDDLAPGDSLEHLHAIENYHRKKILDVLDHIPNVRVAVNVRTDPVQRHEQEEYQYEDSQPLLREQTETMTSREMRDSGEPGARSNTGASIAGAGGNGRTQDTEKTETEFMDTKIVKHDRKVFAGHETQKINVTIAVPRAWVLGIYKGRNPDTDEQPDDAALDEIAAAQLTEIEDFVKPLIETAGEGVVVAKMVPDDSLVVQDEVAIASSPVGGIVSSKWFGSALAAGLGLAALGMMFMLVRKATQPESLPSVEELAGVPPVLPADEDLIGEVEGDEGSMLGVELDESTMSSRRIADQIGELIRANPEEAGALLGRWVRVDE